MGSINQSNLKKMILLEANASLAWRAMSSIERRAYVQAYPTSRFKATAVDAKPGKTGKMPVWDRMVSDADPKSVNKKTLWDNMLEDSQSGKLPSKLKPWDRDRMSKAADAKPGKLPAEPKSKMVKPKDIGKSKTVKDSAPPIDTNGPGACAAGFDPWSAVSDDRDTAPDVDKFGRARTAPKGSMAAKFDRERKNSIPAGAIGYKANPGLTPKHINPETGLPWGIKG
jgi:hypothetical protein